MAEFPKTVTYTGLQIQNEDGSWRTVPGVAKITLTPEKAEVAPQVKSTRAFHFGQVKQPEEYLSEVPEPATEWKANTPLIEPSEQTLDAVDRYAERAGVQLLPWQRKFVAEVMANPGKEIMIHAPRLQGASAIAKTFDKYYQHREEIARMTEQHNDTDPYKGWTKAELKAVISNLKEGSLRLKEVADKYTAENASLQRKIGNLKLVIDEEADDRVSLQRTVVQQDATITTLNRRITNQRTNLRQLNKHVRQNAQTVNRVVEENRRLKSRSENNREYIDSQFKTIDHLRAKAYPKKPHWWSRRPAVDAAEAALDRLKAVPVEVQSPGLQSAITIIEEEIAK